MAMKPFLLAAPRWILVACISGLLFICGGLTEYARELRNDNQRLLDEKQRLYVEITQSNMRSDIEVLKTITQNHADALNEYRLAIRENSAAVLRNSTAVQDLARQVEKLAKSEWRR